MPDKVNNPPHYTQHPSGIECIDVTEHMNFNLGNAVKYIWRAGLKDEAIEDLRKSIWYINREIQRLRMASGKKHASRGPQTGRLDGVGGGQTSALRERLTTDDTDIFLYASGVKRDTHE